MWATAETWVEKLKTLLKTPPPSDDYYPNDRAPSEQIVPTFYLRGYRGEPRLVATSKYFTAQQVGGFIDRHVADMQRRKWPVAKQLVEVDVIALEELADASDAVIVKPHW